MNELEKKLLELDKLQYELKARKKQRGMDFYIPNLIQHKAHLSKAKVIILVKGNRMGGTTWGAIELAFHVTKKYPSWYPQERRFKGPIKIRIATDKYSKINDVIMPKLESFFPKDEIVKTRRSPQGYITKLYTKDGTFIEFLTMEQDPMAFEGQDLDLFWGDEPVERNRYVATQRGLIDRSGFTILTFTPLIEPWMKEDLVDNADGKNIEVFYGSTRDNMYDIEGNSILKEEDIERFEQTLTEDERLTRIEGKFFHLKGVVYKEFNDQHLLSESPTYDNHPVYCVLDPHDRQPHHLIWAMVNKINDVFIIHESRYHGTIKNLSAHIKATEKFYNWNMCKRIIDPNFGKSPSKAGSKITIIRELASFGTPFYAANDNVDVGRQRVRELLHFNRNLPIDINNRPKLYFVRDRVPITIRSVRNLQYEENRVGIDRDPKESVKQKDTHGADTIRYLCIDNPKYHQPAIYEPELAGAYY